MSNLKNTITLERLIEVTNENFNGSIQILDTEKPKNVHSKVKIECLLCGDSYPKRVNDLLHNYGCRTCNGTGEVLKRFRSTESFKQEVHDTTYGEYGLLGEYVSTREKTEFLHIECGNTFEMKVHNFITLGQRCPICKTHNRGRSSSAVDTIVRVIEELGLEYVKEKKFKGLVSRVKSGGLLSFDIFLPQLNLLIEYDGEQHFHPVPIFGGEKWFENCRQIDLKKNEWATENGIELIRFNYKQKGKIKKLVMHTLKERSTTIERI